MGSSGTLTPISTVATASFRSGWPSNLVISPNQSYAYAVSSMTAVNQYSITASGTLTPLSPASLSILDRAMQLAITPNGQFLYITHYGSAAVSQYTIAANGTLAPLTPSTVTTASQPDGVAVAPNGKFAYVVTDASNTLHAFTITATGSLSQFTSYTTSGNPQNVFINPHGKYLYVTVWGGTLYQYSLNSTNGSATYLGYYSAFNYSQYMAFSTTLNIAYVTFQMYTPSFSTLGISGTGTLSSVSHITNPGAAGAEGIALSRDGSYLYVGAQAQGLVYSYAINSSTGSPASIPTTSVSAGTTPWSITVR